jgi:Histidine kinase-, DNA gyrase B-, and HSP90-like ATPase
MSSTDIKRSPLTTDEFGLSFFIQREGEALPENQYVRELTLNGFEAGATTVWIDSIEEEHTGRLLFRITDNGHGMSEESLRQHIKSLFHSGKKLGENHGMGARIATLARNPAGVTWASRAEGAENMVMVIKDKNGVFALENWPLAEPTADGATRDDVVDPDEGHLCEQLLGEGNGTAVILHGNGRDDTWTTTSEIVAYLVKRWWEVPGQIKVWNAAEQQGQGGWRRVQSLKEFLERNAAARRTIKARVDELGEIKIHWALIKEGVDSPWGIRRGQVGALVHNELFQWNDSPYRMLQFGITSRSVQNRLIIVVELPEYHDDNINGWRMTMSRDDIERAGGRNTIDWSKVGEAFVAQMPPEIEALLVTEGTDDDFARIVRKRLGADWNEITRYLPEGTEKINGDEKPTEEVGDLPFKRKRKRKKPVNHITVIPPEEPSGETRESKPKLEELFGAAKEQNYNIPDVKWILADEFGGKPGRAATYSKNANQILMVEDHIFVQQAIAHARKEFRQVSTPVIEKRVRDEFGIETLAKILHVNILHRDPNFAKDDFEYLVSDDALTFSVAGMQAVTERIRKSLSRLGR